MHRLISRRLGLTFETGHRGLGRSRWLHTHSHPFTPLFKYCHISLQVVSEGASAVYTGTSWTKSAGSSFYIANTPTFISPLATDGSQTLYVFSISSGGDTLSQTLTTTMANVSVSPAVCDA